MLELTWRQREIVSMRQRRMTYKEIGKMLKISPSTVRQHLMKAHDRGAPKFGHSPRARGLP